MTWRTTNAQLEVLERIKKEKELGKMCRKHERRIIEMGTCADKRLMRVGTDN